MKKIKLIMPLAAIAATSAVVAPLMTIASCSNAAEWNVFDFGKDGFEYKGGISKITKPSTMFAATTDYMSAVKQEPKIFVQDYANYLYEMQKDEAEKQGYEIKDFKVQITTPVFGSTKAAYPGEGEYTYPTISFKIKHDLTKLVSLAQETITIETKTSGELSYTNVPFFAYPEEKTLLKNDSETYVWSVGVKKLLDKYPFIFQYMDTNFAISGTHDETITTTYAEYEGYKDVRSSHQNYYVDQVADLGKFTSDLQVMAMMMDFNSRYLSAVKISPEIETTAETNNTNSLQLEVLTDATNNKVKIHGLELSKPIDAGETLPTYTIGKNYVLPATITDQSGKLIGTDVYLHINAGAKVSIDTTDRQTITIESDTSASSGKQVELVADDPTKVPEKITGDNFQVHFPHTLEIIEGTTEMMVSIPTSGICVVKGEIVEPTTKGIQFSAQQFIQYKEDNLPTFTPFTYKNGVANDLYGPDKTSRLLELMASISLTTNKGSVTISKELPIYFEIVPDKTLTTQFNIQMTVECAQKYKEMIATIVKQEGIAGRSADAVVAGDKWTFTLPNLPLYDAKNDLTYTIDTTKYSVTFIA